jgi:hypothetical protein
MISGFMRVFYASESSFYGFKAGIHKLAYLPSFNGAG